VKNDKIGFDKKAKRIKRRNRFQRIIEPIEIKILN